MLSSFSENEDPREAYNLSGIFTVIAKMFFTTKKVFVSSRFGDPTGIRTPDPLLKRQLLCRLSYRIIYSKWCLASVVKWLGRLDSNQRVRESKSLALPLGDAPVWSP